MPRPIRRIEIDLPLDYNDGRPIPDSRFTAVEDQLLERFGTRLLVGGVEVAVTL